MAAGDFLDSATGTTLEDYTIRKPICRLVQVAAQSIASATDVAITFGVGSEDIDTHGFHDETTNNTRITPTLAGYYRLTGTFTMASGGSNWTNLSCGFTKNGTSISPLNRYNSGAASGTRSAGTAAIFSANGTSDYFTMVGQQVNATPASYNTNAAAPQQSVFECEFLRPL